MHLLAVGASAFAIMVCLSGAIYCAARENYGAAILNSFLVAVNVAFLIINLS